MLRVGAASLLTVGLLLSARQVSAAPIGYVSFQEFIAGPGGTNLFDVQNLTGAFASPGDFPVLDPLTLLDATLSLIGADGSVTTRTLGDVGPGGVSDPMGALQFDNTTQFASATLTARLSQLRFQLAGGTLFEATSDLVFVTLSPASGDVLFASAESFEFALLDVAGASVPPPLTPVPEPSTMLLLGSALAGLVARSRWRRAAAASSMTSKRAMFG